MKVLLVHNRYLHEGGEERVIDNLAALLQSQGHAVARCERSSREWTSGSFLTQMGHAAEVLHSLPSARQFESQVDSFQPNVVHVHNVFPVLSPSIYRTALTRRVPLVQTLHNYRFLCANGLFLRPDHTRCERCSTGTFAPAVRFGCYGGSRLKSLPMALSLTRLRQTNLLLRAVQVFIAPSRFLRDKMTAAGFPANRFRVIANPAPLEIPLGTPRTATPSFLFVGRLSREKGLGTLLDAFASRRDWSLTLLGDGPLRPLLQRRLEGEGLSHIRLEGAVSPARVRECLASAWALLLPSECYENLPESVREAWGQGTPVIASRLGGMAEMICEGENGWTFEPGQPDALRRRLETLVFDADLRRRMPASCLAFAKRCYDPGDLYAQLMDAYATAIRLRYQDE